MRPTCPARRRGVVNAFLGSATPSKFTRDTVNLTVAYSGAPVRLDLSADDPALRQPLRDRGRRRSVRHRLGAARARDHPRAGLDQGRNDGRFGKGGVGLSVRRGPDRARRRRARDLRRRGPDEEPVRRSRTSSPIRPTGRAGWAGSIPAKTANGRTSTSSGRTSNIDVVAFDNYLPLSDWTTGGGGLDALNLDLAGAVRRWPPSPSTMNGLGLSGAPTIYSIAYLKANIEGGEKFNWYYSDGANAGRGLDPNGSGLMVSLPQGDRLAQARNPYRRTSRLLANKQFRWWWNNTHQAIYDTELDGFRKGRRPNGSRSRSRSPSSNTASQRPIARPISRTSSSTPSRRRAPRRTGRSGTPRRGFPICRGATTRLRRSRSRRSTSTGTSTATTRRRPPALL